MTKLERLAKDWGFADDIEMFKAATFDSVSPGICTNPDCNYSTEVEPDQDRGWCEFCNTNTVASCLVLAGMI